MQLPNSIDTLKKHLLLLFDRLEKGGRLITSSAAGGSTMGAGADNSIAAAKTKAGSSVNSRADAKHTK